MGFGLLGSEKAPQQGDEGDWSGRPVPFHLGLWEETAEGCGAGPFKPQRSAKARLLDHLRASENTSHHQSKGFLPRVCHGTARDSGRVC